jgi:hypothetical protein
MTRLRKAMRDYAGPSAEAPAPRWDADPDLHRAGYPLAFLFQVDVGAWGWPGVLEGEACVPLSLPTVFQRAIRNVT